MDARASASGAVDSGEEAQPAANGAIPAAVDPCAVTQRVKAPVMTWLQPAKGTQTVCEQGIEYTLCVRCESDAVTAVTFSLCDASTYSSWCVHASLHIRSPEPPCVFAAAGLPGCAIPDLLGH